MRKFNAITNNVYGECAEGADLEYGDLTFVIDGIDYDLPSHHWNDRKIDKRLSKGGRCEHSIGTLDITQKG